MEGSEGSRCRRRREGPGDEKLLARELSGYCASAPSEIDERGDDSDEEGAVLELPSWSPHAHSVPSSLASPDLVSMPPAAHSESECARMEVRCCAKLGAIESQHALCRARLMGVDLQRFAFGLDVVSVVLRRAQLFFGRHGTGLDRSPADFGRL